MNPQNLDEIIKELPHDTIDNLRLFGGVPANKERFSHDPTCRRCALESYAAREREQVAAHREHLQDVEAQLAELREKLEAGKQVEGATK